MSQKAPKSTSAKKPTIQSVPSAGSVARLLAEVRDAADELNAAAESINAKIEAIDDEDE